MGGKIMVLDHTGHSTITYGDTHVPEETEHLSEEEVASRFAAIVQHNFAFAVGVPEIDERTGKPTGKIHNQHVKEFDPEVESYIVTRPLVGG